ncbi:MAG: twin-arginine translocation signal domain-containing protein [Bacteroidales bacterium]|jgi:hypothetical protein|nr:twin-arginine translocation signal domain-containing protein [Bacteroidales bacterium]
MKTNRRDFLKKSVLTFGAAAIAGSTAKLISSSPSFDNTKLANSEQVQLLTRFENWVNNYIQVVEDEKLQNREFKNNQALTTLPDELEKWMPELKKHMADKQFATEYLKISERLTQVIDHKF